MNSRRTQWLRDMTTSSFNRIMEDASLRPEHVVRAVISFSGSLYDEAAAEVPKSLPTIDRVAAMLDDNDSVSLKSFRARQLALLECMIQFIQLTDEQYFSIDITVHLSAADTLTRYTTAWLRFFRRAEQEFESNVDLESLDATLGDALAVFLFGYGFKASGVKAWTSPVALTSAHSGALQDVLAAAGRQVLPSRRLEDVAVGLRVFIRQRLQFSVSDAVLLAMTGLEAYDKYAPRLDRGSVLMQVALTGKINVNEPNLAQMLLFGYPEIEQTFGLPLVAIRQGLVLQGYVRFKTTLLAALAYLANVILVEPTGVVSKTAQGVIGSSVGALLALPLWSVLVAMAGVRTLRIFNAMGAAAREQEAHARDYARWSRAVDYVEQQQRREQGVRVEEVNDVGNVVAQTKPSVRELLERRRQRVKRL